MSFHPVMPEYRMLVDVTELQCHRAFMHSVVPCAWKTGGVSECLLWLGLFSSASSATSACRASSVSVCILRLSIMRAAR